MKDTKVGLVGVGLMGQGIAVNIQRSGAELYFLAHEGNKSTDAIIAAGGHAVQLGCDLAACCETIILCVTGSPQVEDILTRDDGILEGLRPGAVIIDCSTAMPDSTQRMAELVTAAGGHFLDAPMTRTPKEAAAGKLNLIVGGEEHIFDSRLPLLRTFAENITYAGPVGSGHMMKLLHNFVSLGFSVVLAEAAVTARRAGIEPSVFTEVLEKGGGRGAVLDRLAPFIERQDTSHFQFTLSNACKDTGYYLETAKSLGLATRTAEAVQHTYRTAVDAGNEQAVVPELIRLLDE